MRFLLGQGDENHHEYSDEEVNYLVGINIFGALLSLLGALFVIINYWTFSSLRKNFAFKLIYWIGVSDLILAISNLMGAPSDGSSLCYTQSILQQFGQISSVLWVVIVSWTINHLTKLTKLPTHDELNKLRNKMHIFVWIFAVITTLLPFTTMSYGVAAGWCWIKGENDLDIMWRYICFYIPLWFGIIYMIYVYIKVFKRLKSIHDIDEHNDENDENEQEASTSKNNDRDEIAQTYNSDQFPSSEMNINQTKLNIKSQQEIEENNVVRKQNNTLQRMKFYPMILIICFFWATIRRIVDWATIDQTPFFLAVLHTFFAAIPGFLDAIVYGLTKDVKQKDTQFIRKHCGCCQCCGVATKEIINDDEKESINNPNYEDDDDDDDKL